MARGNRYDIYRHNANHGTDCILLIVRIPFKQSIALLLLLLLLQQLNSNGYKTSCEALNPDPYGVLLGHVQLSGGQRQ